MFEGDCARRVGGVGIFGFADLANFGSCFRFSHVKTVVFRFWCLVWFASLLQFSLWFSVLVNNDGFFLNFFSPGFSGLPRKLHSALAQKARIAWSP